MNHAISVEVQFFLRSILWGGLLLLVYDGLRIVRRLIKHDSFFIAVEDLIFWVAASLFIFIMMYKENNGIIRGFSVMGMTIGMLLYHYIFSELLVNAITKFICTLFRPFAIAFGKVKRFILYLSSIAKKFVNFLLRRLKKIRKSVKIVLSKRKQKMEIKRHKQMEKKALVKKEHEKKVADNKAAKNKVLKKKTTKNNTTKNNTTKNNTTKNNLTKDKTSKDKTSKDKTSKDKTSKDKTSKDKTSKDKTSKDNTTKDNTIKENTTNISPNMKKTTEDKFTTNKAIGDKTIKNNGISKK